MDLTALLDRAIEARGDLLDARRETAFRVFNGFCEGVPTLAIDLYGRTLVLHDHADSPEGDEARARSAVEHLGARWPWLRAALWKVRASPLASSRNGRMLLGERADLDRTVREGGVRYSFALDHNRDAGLYLDTRNLRAWARARLAGKRILNAFAYTGSLGVAARAAPAATVIHVDLNREFLAFAKASYGLNGFPVKRAEFRATDIFEAVGRLKAERALFDCVFLDPPFFSETRLGRVDLEGHGGRIVNKLRPLVADGGFLVAINNAVFVSGADWVRTLETIGDGYLALDELIPVPEDFAGYPDTRVGAPLVDPAPFNHSTKIAVLRVTRRDGRKAT